MNLNGDEDIQETTEKNNILMNENPSNNSSNSPEPEEILNNNKYLGANITTRKWRVKLYRLNDIGQWDDHGIGFVFCTNSKDVTGKTRNELIMINEINQEEMFNINIDKSSNIEFHNQRGTIMTWKTGDEKGDDNTAISFQEKEGVLEIRKNILICGGKNPNDEDILMETQQETACYDVSIQNLPNLVRELNFDMGEKKLKNFINYLKNTNCEFIIKIGELLKDEEQKIESLKTAETSSLANNNNPNSNINPNVNTNINNDYYSQQQQIYKKYNLENIHYIFTIFKNLILIGDRELLKILIDDKYYLVTFGALEYDFETMKLVPHRTYFKQIVIFKNPLNIKEQDILYIINQNLRLTYLRDTALSRLIEDNAIKTINILLQLNHNDIIQFFLNDEKYLQILFEQLQSEDLNIKKEACLFLSELIECSNNVPQSRATFSEYLFEHNILLILGKIIDENNNSTNNSNTKDMELQEFIKITAVEIFINILTIIPNIILDYLKKEKDHTLLRHLTNIMLFSENFGIKYEICQIYKTLIETQLKDQTMDRMELFSEPFMILLKYLNTPITGVPPAIPGKESECPPEISHKKRTEISSTKQIIIEILITWFSLMNFNKQFWVGENKLNKILVNLLGEPDKIINLHSIKLLKCIIDLDDPFLSNQILSKELCDNLSKLFLNNIKKNNIIISCLMNFFDSLSQNKEVVFNNLMTILYDFFYENEKYFKIIIMRYEHKSTPKKELINYLKNDYKDNVESLFLGDFDYNYKDIGEFYNDDEKIINFINKKRERSDYNEDLFDNLFDNYNFEHKSHKFNEHEHKVLFGHKNYENENDNDHGNYCDDDNDDGIIKNDFLSGLNVNGKNNDNNDNNNSSDEYNDIE